MILPLVYINVRAMTIYKRNVIKTSNFVLLASYETYKETYAFILRKLIINAVSSKGAISFSTFQTLYYNVTF